LEDPVADTRHNDHDVELVRSFANTVDVEDGTDELASAEAFTAWLRARKLLAGSDAAKEEDLSVARDLRHAVRAEMASHHDRSSDPAARRALDRLAADLPMRVAFDHPDSDRPTLVPVGTDARGALARVVASMYALARDGAWDRLKICPDDTCGWAFYDESRNRSRRWCSMGVCGNRNKVRAYREREASPPAGMAGSPA
jgi:predicted RNA-binding Zn ribbon-like protein